MKLFSVVVLFLFGLSTFSVSAQVSTANTACSADPHPMIELASPAAESAILVVSPSKGALRRLELSAVPATDHQRMLCVTLDEKIPSDDFAKFFTLPSGDGWVLELDPSYGGKVKATVYDWQEGKSPLVEIAATSFSVTADRPKTVVQCLKQSSPVDIAMFAHEEQQGKRVELHGGGLHYVDLPLGQVSSEAALNFCMTTEDSQFLQHVRLVPESGRVVDHNYRVIVDVEPGYDGEFIAYLLDESNLTGAGEPDNELAEVSGRRSVLSKVVMKIGGLLGITQEQLVCNRQSGAYDVAELPRPLRLGGLEQKSLRSGGLRPLKLPRSAFGGSSQPVLCLASERTDFREKVKFFSGKDQILGNEFVTYLDIAPDFTGKIRAYVLQNADVGLVSAEEDYFSLAGQSRELQLSEVAEISVKPKLEYMIRQDGREVKQSLTPYQEVYLWFPEREVAIDLHQDGESSNSDSKRRLKAVGEARVENDVEYFVYNLGDFDPGENLSLSLADSTDEAAAKWFVPRRKLFVRPANYSLRFGKGLMESAGRAPEFVSLYVRLRRWEWLTSSVGATVGLSVDPGAKVYFGGFNMEMYDSISLTVGGAFVEAPETNGLSDMKTFLGLSADLRIVTDFLGGISKMYRGSD